MVFRSTLLFPKIPIPTLSGSDGAWNWDGKMRRNNDDGIKGVTIVEQPQSILSSSRANMKAQVSFFFDGVPKK